MLFTSYLALEIQVTSVSAKCFFQLRQLRRVRRSLDRDNAATLVHTFVTSRIDYGNALLTNALKIWTEKLQRVLNTAARVITDTRKFDSVFSHMSNCGRRAFCFAGPYVWNSHPEHIRQ